MAIEDWIGNAERFPVLSRWDYFNHAGISPLPTSTAAAMTNYLVESQQQVYLDTDWFHIGEGLRKVAATLINAHRDEIALVKNTAEGITTVARTMDWTAGDRIVLTDVEYPANVYPWMQVAKEHGVELIMLPERDGPDGTRAVRIDEILEAIDHPRTKLVALSHVQYASGQRLDLVKIGAACRAKGVRFCVDAIQSAGAVPVDVVAMKIDYLACGGQKWLIGPPGSAFFYCRRELLPTLRPLIIGADNVINAMDYGNYDYTLKADASRLEAGTPNLVGNAGLKAAIELLLQLGIDAIATRLKAIGDRFIERVTQKGYRVVSLREGEAWSGMVNFVSPTHDHAKICKMLQKEHRTEILVREKRLRFAPHFYNTFEQADRLVEHLPGHE